MLKIPHSSCFLFQVSSNPGLPITRLPGQSQPPGLEPLWRRLARDEGGAAPPARDLLPGRPEQPQVEPALPARCRWPGEAARQGPGRARRQGAQGERRQRRWHLRLCDEKTEAGSKRSRATKDGFVEPGLRPLERGLARLGGRQPIVQVRDPADGAGVHQGADPAAQVDLPGELKKSSECSSSNACWTSSCVSQCIILHKTITRSFQVTEQMTKLPHKPCKKENTFW